MCIAHAMEGTFAQRVPGAPSIQMNVPAIYHNALAPNITASPGPGTLRGSPNHVLEGGEGGVGGVWRGGGGRGVWLGHPSS